MVIYIDGPNNTGKTTLVNKLAEVLREKQYVVNIFHADENFENTKEAYTALIDEHEDDILILDRGWLGEQVYPYLRKRIPKISRWEIACLSNKNSVYTFITNASTTDIEKAALKKKEVFDKIETIQEINLFGSAASYLSYTGCKYDLIRTLCASLDVQINQILEVLDFPKNLKKICYAAKGYAADAGVDILIDKDIMFEPGTTTIVELPVKITPEEGQMAYLIERTSAAKKGLFVHSCPIDANYTGAVHAIVYNSSKFYVQYKAGEAFCQVVNVSINYPKDIPCKKEGKRTDSCFGGTDGNTSKNS